MSAIQLLKRLGSALDAWTCDPATGLFTRNYAIAEAGTIDFTMTGNVNDLNEATLPGISEAYRVRLNPSGDFFIGGMQAGVHGEKKRITNVSNSNTILFFNGAVAAAANQWRTPKFYPFYLQPWQSMDVQYDGDIDKWLCCITTVSSVTLSVNLTALATDELGYFNVDLSGTFAGIAANDPIIVNPVADVAAAGAGNGGLINARISATNTCRLAFMGAIPAGAQSFVFSVPMGGGA